MVRKKQIAALFTALLIVLQLSSCSSTPEREYKIPEKMNKVQSGVIDQNDRFVMKWDNDQKCVILENKETGHVWCTIPYDAYLKDDINSNLISPLNISYYLPDEAADDLSKGYECIENQLVSSEKDGRKLKLKFYFSDPEITVPLEFELHDDHITASVPFNEIEESGKALLTEVSVLPYFCSVPNSNDKSSYLFVPSGSGALMYADENVQGFSRSFTGKVFGEDLASTRLNPSESVKNVLMPVFGAKYNNNSLFAVISGNSEAATIIGDAGNSRYGYSAVYAKFMVRAFDQIEVKRMGYQDANIYAEEFDPNTVSEISYYPLHGENADYNGMASLYRSILAENGVLNKANAAESPVYSLSILGGATAKAYFLGVPYSKLYVATSYQQAGEIIGNLSQATGLKPSVTLLGFGSSGMDYGEIGGGFKVLKAFGGAGKHSELQKYCKENGVPLFTDFDLLHFQKSSNGFSTIFDSAKTASKKLAAIYPVRKNLQTPDYSGKKTSILSRQKLEKAVEMLLKFSGKQQIKGISLRTLGQSVYSDYSDTNYFAGKGSAKQVSEIINTIRTAGHTVSLSAANIYAAGMADCVSDVPLDAGGLSVLDESVPFYQMVLRGNTALYSPALNTSAVLENDLVLKAVAFGVFPSFSLCCDTPGQLADSDNDVFFGSKFSSNREGIIEVLSRTGEYFKSIGSKQIKRYEILSKNLSKTVFEDGSMVTVNYSNEDIVLNGVTYKAKSYKYTNLPEVEEIR